MRSKKFALALACAGVVLMSTAASAEPVRAGAALPSAPAPSASQVQAGARVGAPVDSNNERLTGSGWLLLLLGVGAAGAGLAAGLSGGDSNSPG